MEVHVQSPSSNFDLVPKPRFSYSEMLESPAPGAPNSSCPDSPVAPSDDRRLSEMSDSGRLFCDTGEPTSGAAMKVQKVYRSYRTRRMLADSAVVAEELWWQAINYARLNHSTISFFNFSKPETAASRWNRISLNAAKVGKGLSKDATAQKLAFQHWIEAIDPRHRYGHFLHMYYEEWCKTDDGQPFFFWLDVGEGKDVDLKDCPKSSLRQHCIKYLGPQEREHFEYIVEDGKLVHKQTGDFLDTTKGKPGAKWIFVMSASKKLYCGPALFGFGLQKKKGTFHHSSFLAGGATLAAGRLEVEEGTVQSLSPYSGHYRPTDDSFDSFLLFLKQNGVNVDAVKMRNPKDEYENFEESKSIRDNFEESKSIRDEDAPELSMNSGSPQSDDTSKGTEEFTEASKRGTEPSYKRTLSGGLRSPRADVPKEVILKRINSKKAASSYQLGHQLSRTWSTGAGPRIGCINDYPVELRLQALELVNLSPRIRSPISHAHELGIDQQISSS